MRAQTGWVVIYRAKNGWTFRSRAFETQADAINQAHLQKARGVFACVKIVGPAGEKIDLEQARGGSKTFSI